MESENILSRGAEEVAVRLGSLNVSLHEPPSLLNTEFTTGGTTSGEGRRTEVME